MCDGPIIFSIELAAGIFNVCFFVIAAGRFGLADADREAVANTFKRAALHEKKAFENRQEALRLLNKWKVAKMLSDAVNKKESGP